MNASVSLENPTSRMYVITEQHSPPPLHAPPLLFLNEVLLGLEATFAKECTPKPDGNSRYPCKPVQRITVLPQTSFDFRSLRINP